MAQQDGDSEVKVRIDVPDDEFEGCSAYDLSGEYAVITDHRSILYENGAVVIVADVSNHDD